MSFQNVTNYLSQGVSYIEKYTKANESNLEFENHMEGSVSPQAKSHREMRSSVAAVVPVALSVLLCVYHTIPAVVGLAIGAGTSVTLNNSKDSKIKESISKIKTLWESQDFKVTFTMVSLSFVAISVILNPPVSAFLTMMGIGVIFTPYAQSYAQSYQSSKTASAKT